MTNEDESRQHGQGVAALENSAGAAVNHTQYNTTPRFTSMAEMPQWVGYRLKPKLKDGLPVLKANGKPKMDKIPINPHSGGNARTNDAATWGTYKTAVAAIERYQLSGVGFVFTKAAEVVGVDLDDCFDEEGELSPFATDVITLLDSYCEISPSGDGVHILLRGTVQHAIKKDGIEIYGDGRFFTYTGKRLPGHERGVAWRQAQLDQLVARISTKPTPANQVNGNGARETAVLPDDQTVLHKAMNAHNGGKFLALWNGETAAYSSQSEADFALCHLLAFWTGKDTAAIDRLFRQSALYRPKWDENHYSSGETYGQQTIARAITNTIETYAVQPISQNGQSMEQVRAIPSANSMHEPIAGLRPLSLSALLNREFAPLVFLVDELIAKGQLVMLAGRPKSGKSWLVMQLAMCVDSGEPFLARTTRRAKVLYIALEDGERRVYQRARLLKWQPQATAVLFDIAKFDGGQGTPGPGLSQIRQATADYDLIIIDTLIATLSGAANENDNVQMGMIINELARIAHENEVAIVLVHHTGKGMSDDVFNTLRGASALRGGYDVGLLLERKNGEREAVLHAESRDVDVGNMTLRQLVNGAGWEYVGDAVEMKQIRAGKATLEAMLELGATGNGLTAKEIAQHRGVSEAAVYKHLKRLLEDGYVDKVENPSTEDGKQADLYFVREVYR